MGTGTRLAFLLAVLTLPFVVAADEEAAPATGSAVVSALEKALAAAKAADWEGVVARCHEAINAAQKMTQGGMEAVFPGAPGAGWKAGKIESQRMSMTGEGQGVSAVHLSRRYTHEEQGLVVNALLTNWTHLQQSMRGMLQLKEQQQMMKMMGMTFFEKAGFPCLKVVPPEGGSATILAFGEKRMLQVECPQGKAEAAQAVFGGFDLKKTLVEPKAR